MRGLTDDIRKTLNLILHLPVRLNTMITSPPLECLREINSRLLGFPLEVEFMYTTLCDHYTAAFAVILNQ